MSYTASATFLKLLQLIFYDSSVMSSLYYLRGCLRSQKCHAERSDSEVKHLKT